MKAQFDVWRVATVKTAYTGEGYGVNGFAVRISKGFAKNHCGYSVWVAVVRFTK